jgi:hypothetical protein
MLSILLLSCLFLTGCAAPYDPYGAGEMPAVERYWAERTENTAFGMAGRCEAVLAAQ